MRPRTFIRHIAAVAITILGTAAAADAQVARFTDKSDAVGGRFFNAATSRVDPLNPNRLIIGLDTGMDWTTWKTRDFKASTAAYSYGVASDTIAFRVYAPAGYYVAGITYTQRGTASSERLGKAMGSASWVVADVAAPLGTFGVSPAVTSTIDLTGFNLRMVPVSITTTLFAYAPPAAGAAAMAISGADVRVRLLPLVQTE